MAKRNFLLGKGERLAEVIRVGSNPVIKIAPYTFSEAQERLQPMLEKVVSEIDKLPADACPDDLAVATITLNPEYIAKSYFPAELLRAAGLETVGSRSRNIIPEKKSLNREPEQAFTTELFVKGKRLNFRRWATILPTLDESSVGAKQITGIEEISFPSAASKVKSVEKSKEKIVYEVVLHIDEESAENKYLNTFKNYLKKRQITPDFDHRFYAGGLCFVEMEAAAEEANYIAQFSLVRVVREMPSLRLLRPAFRTGAVDKAVKVTLPDIDPFDSKIKAAIFDGGIPDGHPITRWAIPHDVPGIGAKVPELLEHGVGVTSAFLFGHIDPNSPLPRPYSYVDHYRVLDDIPGENPVELYEILDRISNVLKTSKYDFINISLGPQLPIDDDEVHAWTAVLDEHLSDGLTLATIAVGNDGEGDPDIQANRIQVPADCVNALAIGACDVPDDHWQRTSYSSVGPGRSPGIIKPDLVEFGGSIQRPFLTLDSVIGTNIIPTGGTSFSSPSTMRMGTGVRAHLGPNLSQLAIRALLVHCCESSQLPKLEVGWGRLARELDEIVICDDTVMRVVYQGKISASKYMRCPIPVPRTMMTGMVTIKATLCYATPVDPHHPENYTRSGLEIFFRPDKDKKREDEDGTESEHALTKTFFGAQQKDYQTEEELRKDAWKWENCMHAKKRFRGSSLNDPVFDIHYNARMEGHNDTRGQEINFVLVITVEAPKVRDLYDQVVRRYATLLEQLVPVIDIPIRINNG